MICPTLGEGAVSYGTRKKLLIEVIWEILIHTVYSIDLPLLIIICSGSYNITFPIRTFYLTRKSKKYR